MAVDEKVSYCQVDAHLDTNPKIRRAGRDGREVFLFLLRRVAIGRTEGTVPLKYIEPWYLADQLMMSDEVTASNGVSRAVTANLIVIDEVAGVVRLVGWSAEWGRRPKTNAERQADHRANRLRKYPEMVGVITGSDAPLHQVTRSNESNALDQIRREEKKRETRSRGTPLPDGWQPDRTTDANVKAHTAARTRGVDLHAELEKLRDHAKANPKFNRKTDWDATWRNWIRNAKGSVPLTQHQGEFRPRNQIA